MEQKVPAFRDVLPRSGSAKKKLVALLKNGSLYKTGRIRDRGQNVNHVL